MKWYLAKMIYRIICGEGSHKAQFEEQLRLINAIDELAAFYKAKALGINEEECFFNNNQKLVQWKFIAVADLQFLEELTDGAELNSRVFEQEDADNYSMLVNARALQIESAYNQLQLITN